MSKEKPRCELKKVFNSIDMPSEVKDLFYLHIEIYNPSKDTYIPFYLESRDNDKLIYDWLLANGATIEDKMVLIEV